MVENVVNKEVCKSGAKVEEQEKAKQLKKGGEKERKTKSEVKRNMEGRKGHEAKLKMRQLKYGILQLLDSKSNLLF